MSFEMFSLLSSGTSQFPYSLYYYTGTMKKCIAIVAKYYQKEQQSRIYNVTILRLLFIYITDRFSTKISQTVNST